MADSIRTRFTERFSIRYPIAQAGMAFAGWSPPLAIAVARAGGIGAIGAGLLPPDVVRGMVQALKAANAGPFHINFLTPSITTCRRASAPRSACPRCRSTGAIRSPR